MRTACLTIVTLMSFGLLASGIAGATEPTSAVPAPSPAQPGSVDQARAKAEKGGELYDSGRFAEALNELSAAYAVVPAPTIELLVAQCQVKLGMLLEARDHYRHISTTKLVANADPVFYNAQRSANSDLMVLETQIPKIRVILKEAQADTVAVTVDGTPLNGLDASVDVNPGEHVIEVTTQGRKIITRKASAAIGKTEVVALSLAPEMHPPRGLSPAPGPTSTSGPSLRMPTWVLLGAGILGIGAGAVTGALALAQHGQIASRCDGNHGCIENDKDLASSGKALATASTTSLVLGGAAIASGTILLFVDAATGAPSKTPLKNRAFTLCPALGLGGIALSGEF